MSQPRNASVAANGVAPALLSPRSLVLSLLLGMRRPRRPGAELVAWCGLFGVADGTARVALTRMVRSGDLVNEGGVYALSERLRVRRADQEFALAPRFVDDGGEWTMFVVVGAARPAADRAALRDILRHARYAERREGVWLRPANLATLQSAIVAEQCERYLVRPPAARELAATLFAPAAWKNEALSRSRELAAAASDLDSDAGLAAAFVAGAAIAAQLRSDPLLPVSLLPARWPGAELRVEYREFRDEFSSATHDWFARRR